MHVSYLGFIFMWELHMMLLMKSLNLLMIHQNHKLFEAFHQILPVTRYLNTGRLDVRLKAFTVAYKYPCTLIIILE